MDNLNNQHNFESEEAGALNLWDLLQILKANWYWFVLSVIVCLGLAYLYLLQAPRVYTGREPMGASPFTVWFF